MKPVVWKNNFGIKFPKPPKNGVTVNSDWLIGADFTNVGNLFNICYYLSPVGYMYWAHMFPTKLRPNFGKFGKEALFSI